MALFFVYGAFTSEIKATWNILKMPQNTAEVDCGVKERMNTFRLRKENADKEKIREQETTRLHQTQKFLKHEQRKLKQVRIPDHELLHVSTDCTTEQEWLEFKDSISRLALLKGNCLKAELLSKLLSISNGKVMALKASSCKELTRLVRAVDGAQF